MAKQFAHVRSAPDGTYSIEIGDVQLHVGDSLDVADRLMRRLNEAVQRYAQHLHDEAGVA